MTETLTPLAENFMCAFVAEWCERSENPEQRQQILESYPHDGLWTDYMLSKDGALASVARRMSAVLPDLMYYGKPIYTIDAMLVGAIYPEDLIGRSAGGYPGRLYALIEHENAEAVEEEMWKLLWWRGPLKVIIFYDWSDEARARSEPKRRWLEKKLSLFHRMWSSVKDFHPEHQDTTYLFLVGSRANDVAFPQWRYATAPSFIAGDLPAL